MEETGCRETPRHSSWNSLCPSLCGKKEKSDWKTAATCSSQENFPWSPHAWWLQVTLKKFDIKKNTCLLFFFLLGANFFKGAVDKLLNLRLQKEWIMFHSYRTETPFKPTCERVTAVFRELRDNPCILVHGTDGEVEPSVRGSFLWECCGRITPRDWKKGGTGHIKALLVVSFNYFCTKGRGRPGYYLCLIPHTSYLCEIRPLRRSARCSALKYFWTFHADYEFYSD